MTGVRLAVAGLLLFAVVSLIAAQPSRDRATLAEGLALLHRGQAAKSTKQKRIFDEEALLRFKLLIRKRGIRNGRLYYDLGNTYDRIGDIGRAILAYRRAELYIPGDPNLIHNLDYARSQRLDKLPSGGAASVLPVLFFWHYDMSVELQTGIFASSFGLIWLFVGLRVLLRRRWLDWPVGVAAAAALIFLGSLVWRQEALASNHAGVLVARRVVARRGDALSYDPAFKGDLHAGTEFTLLSVRTDWYRIELTDGATAWIPQSSARLVRPISAG